MRRTLLFLMILALAVSTSAQDSPYRLQTPSAEDYIATLIEHGTALVEGTGYIRDNEGYQRFPHELVGEISAIVFYLYPNAAHLDFEQQYTAYEALQMERSSGEARGIWGRRIVTAWLAENDVDLSSVTELAFEDFYITVEPRDFNADGVDEYLLDVTKGVRVDRETCVNEAEIVDYMVVQQTDSGYRVVETGLPWKGLTPFGRYDYAVGGMIEYYFGDLTGDGIPEWVVLMGNETAGGPGMGYVDQGILYIVGWRGDGFSFLVHNQSSRSAPAHESLGFASLDRPCDAGGPYPATVDWVFENIDDDAALEIAQVQRYTDSWYCRRTESRMFDWDEIAWEYVYTEIVVAYSTDSQRCAQRQAEEIMWTGDYAAAIPVYEHALTLETDSERENIIGLNQYLRARLAFAYIMTGQRDRAEPLLTTLLDEEQFDAVIGEYINLLMVMLEADASPLEICVATYNLFTINIPEIRVGFTSEDITDYPDDPYQPENIGCDAPTMLRQTLDNTTIPADVSPIEFLQELGIGSLRVIDVDMNGDGLVEWMVWPDVAGSEVFFALDGDHYTVSYPELDPFLRASDIQAWRLPGNGGTGIALTLMRFQDQYFYYFPWRCAYSPMCGIGGGGPQPMCPPEQNSIFPGSLRMWRLDGTNLVQILAMNTCVPSLSEFPGAEALPELTVTIYYDANSEPGFIPPPPEETYVWNDDEQRYVHQEPPPPAETPTPAPTPVPSPTLPSYWRVSNAFEERDFEAIVDMTPDTLTIVDPMVRDDVLLFHYIRALSLEALGRTDEALAAYVAIYEAAPNHIWGILARLHFAPIEE